MTDATGHLPYWTVEQLAEGDLSHRERTLAEAHVRQCAHCAAELQSARALLVGLQRLPQLAPSRGFAEAVMARVQLQPEAVPASLLSGVPARRWPSLVRVRYVRLAGAAVVALAALVAMAAWMGFDLLGGMRALGGGVRGWTREVAWNVLSEGTEMLIRTGLFQWGADVLAAIPGPTAGGVPVVLIALAAAVPVSGWMMTRLLRAPLAGGIAHA